MNLRLALAFAAGFFVSTSVVFLKLRRRTTLEKSTVLAVLKDLSLKSSGCLITLANFSRELRKKAGSEISDDEIASVIVQHSPLIERLHASQTEVYAKHGLTEEIVKESCENDFKHNR